MKRTVTILIAAFIGITAAKHSPATDDFESFKAFHKKSYPSAVHEMAAKAAFQSNLAKLKAQNAAFHRGESTHQLELNAFADQNPVEFVRARNGLKLPHLPINSRKRSLELETLMVDLRQVSGNNASTNFSWVDLGKVGDVRDQGQCGSCWAFSAMGSLEGQRMINGGNKVNFSEQELVDCDTIDSGCNGGLPSNAWTWLNQNGGAELDSDYPYTSGVTKTNGTCQMANATPVQQVNGFNNISMPASNQDLMAYLQKNGPLSIGVYAAGFDWQLYSGGVMNCPFWEHILPADHAVLLVGYSSDSWGPYWIIQNSWGTGWGENGFVRIRQGWLDCGVNQWLAGYPLVPAA